ncbi:MAG TPA: ribosome biogenesis GTPase Der [Fibrobacteres bacterium]|jgi:GTP-binding protein|nr:ribosome biogenesis GTPase Der [Fibrobacterota bacterium]
MSLPCAVIVGRPNVGKSSLFNRVLGRRAAVVADREGVTRDRHYQDAEWAGKRFRIVDTGGFMPKSDGPLDDQVRKQITTALEEASVVVFVLDGRTGVTAQDQDFARLVLRGRRPVLLAVNKSEKRSAALEAAEAWSLGMGEPHPVSALTGFGIQDMLDVLVQMLPDSGPDGAPRDVLRLAVLGRPNAGKSTLVNALLGEDRVVTSEKAGTTRDAIDTELEYKEHRVILTDTAGLRKKARVDDEVEHFANLRALEAIRRSQVCVLLVDATLSIGEQDFRICQKVQEAGRGLFIVLNKWDAVDAGDKTFDHMVKEIHHRNPELQAVPFLAVSAMSGKRVTKVLEMAMKVKENLERILGRENVIEFFNQTLEIQSHPSTSRGPVNLSRCCQVLVDPVALAFETSHPERVLPSYVRFLRRRAVEHFDLMGVPVRIWFRSRFQLRTDEELESYMEGHREGFQEWNDAEWEEEGPALTPVLGAENE